MPYDLTYNRNLMNKTNKQRKTKTKPRDMEIKNKLTGTRVGEEWGVGERRGRF